MFTGRESEVKAEFALRAARSISRFQAERMLLAVEIKRQKEKRSDLMEAK